MIVRNFLFAALALTLVVMTGSMYVVKQTEQALVLQFGDPKRVVREPGLYFKVPLVQNVEIYDRRLLDFDAEAKELIAADQKRLIVDAFVRYRIVDPLKFKQTVGDERTMSSRLNTILEASLRQVVSAQPLSAVISEERAAMMKRVRTMVNAQVTGRSTVEVEGAPPVVKGGFGIEIADVRIVRADLPKENSESIFRRMQTEREQEAKSFRAQGAEDAQKIRSTADKQRTILLAEARKKSEILRGEGDSEAIKIFAEAINADPEFYQFYRTMQAYRKTLSGKDTTMIMSPENDFLRYLEKGAGSAR